MTQSVSWPLPAAFHIWPEVRIIAGMEASTMTSLGDVEIGDAFVGVDHRDGGARGEDSLDVSLDRGLLVGGEFFDFAEEVAEAVVQIDAERGEGGGVFREEILEEHADAEAEHDRVGDLHHGGLEVEREERVVFLRLHDLLGEEGARAFRFMKVASKISPALSGVFS